MRKTKTILGAVVMLFIMMSACKKDTNPLNNKPVACFTASRDTILYWDTVQFNASCSKGATSYKWAKLNGYGGDLSTSSGDKTTYLPDWNGQVAGLGNISFQLITTNSKGVDTITKDIYMRVPRPLDYEASYTCFDSCSNPPSPRSPDYTLTITPNGNNSITLTGLEASPVNANIQQSGDFIISSGSYAGKVGGMELQRENAPKIGLFVIYWASNCRSYCLRK